jgi:hypothetical protein
MMRKKKPHVATPEEVTITRSGEDAIIEYRDPKVATTHLSIGPEVQQMSDQEILEILNKTITAMERMAAEYEHIAIEIPPGQPQIEYSKESMQWVPRGHVLRCIIDDGGPDFQAVVHIDDHELSLCEFGRLLCSGRRFD